VKMAFLRALRGSAWLLASRLTTSEPLFHNTAMARQRLIQYTHHEEVWA
jgi:hypothetical protein